MNVPPEVSVIIPNYNHALFLKQRIDSVLSQTFEDFEVIILDDNSTDGSREIIDTYRGHPKISHIVFNPINSGSAFKQWKKGIGLAKAQYIWIAESDDYNDKDFLALLVNKLREKNVSLAYCRTTRIVDGKPDCTGGEKLFNLEHGTVIIFLKGVNLSIRS